MNDISEGYVPGDIYIYIKYYWIPFYFNRYGKMYFA